MFELSEYYRFATKMNAIMNFTKIIYFMHRMKIMNIYTQVCGLAIIGMLLYFYKKQPTMGLSSERHFITTLYLIFGCVLLDIASCYFIVNSSKYSNTLVMVVAKLYLISLQAVAFSAFKYTVSDIVDTRGSRHEKALDRLINAFFLLGLFVTFNLPLNYYYDGAALYSYGQAAIATYVLTVIYILSIIVSSIILRPYIKKRKINALLVWMAIWCLTALIQFFKPQLLIVSFASCIGALIMYFEMENPQGAISRKTGHFSSAVIRDYLDFLYQNRKPFSAMMISFRTAGDAATENKMLRKTIEMLSEFLFNIDTAKVFDTVEGYFLLVFESNDFMESTKFKIATYFQSVEDNPDIEGAITLLNPFYTIVPSSSIASDADELLMLLSNFIPTNYDTLAKNEVVVNSETMAELRKRKQVEKMVVEAMEEDRIEVFYQPIYNLTTETFTGAEALVRIRLHDGTLVFPNDFIPIVEETGRIIPLSDSIYRKVLSFMKSYRIERLGIEKVELNLSVKQGESPVFVNRFIELLDKNSVPPILLNFEITETSSLKSKENLLVNMEKLKTHGISFSLDDFGAGSSNLNYMIDMPVEIVKLDKYLTEEYFRSTKAQAIVKTVIEMAHSMDIRIIAEGIERQEQFDAMKILGVDYIQGYYFSHPLPEHEFLKFIQKNNL